MSWNEAYATWNAIQVAQNRQKAFLKGVADSISLRNQDTNRQTAMLPSLPPMVQSFAQNLANFFQLASNLFGLKPGTQAINTAPTDSKNPFQSTSAQAEAGMKLVTSRLSNILGEMRTLTEEQTKAAIEWVKNFIIEKQWKQKLILILSESWELLSQFNPSQKLKSAFQSLLSWLGLSEISEPTEETLPEASKKAP
jgi:hypothetical protein